MASKRKQELITLAVVFAGVVVVSALAAYYLGGGGRQAPTTTPGARPAGTPTATFGPPEEQPAATTQAQRPTASTEPATTEADSFIDHMFGTQHTTNYVLGNTWAETMGRITLRFLLAALLGAALAFRPRKRILALKRNPYVSQTQILLAIVAAALMVMGTV